ncbi:uncharacterized protein LOC128323143 [Hemicordylus capensis]|uniref:uncharacterized protein LOC128323143 n=1 Tax=Hemicordylus capensis TaxID=884348 RepID=UPI0023022C16|nr:uncharacterized protein LOC128323143 [Hemicordylus capensis]
MVDFLINTGATHSVMTEKYEGRLGERIVPIIGVNGQKLHKPFLQPMDCEVGNRQLSHQFLYMLECPLLLCGSDMLCKMRAELEISPGRITLYVSKEEGWQWQACLLGMGKERNACSIQEKVLNAVFPLVWAGEAPGRAWFVPPVHIELEENVVPPRILHYPVRLETWLGLQHTIQRFLKYGPLRECQVPFNTPVLPVKGVTTGEYRVVWDLRAVNQVVEDQRKAGYAVVSDYGVLEAGPLVPGWIEAFPCCTCKAREVTKKLLKETIPRFGLPYLVGLDNGPSFVSQVVQQVSKALDITGKLHAAYRPQSSAKVEWANQILKQHLSKICQETSLKWIDALPLALRRVRVVPKGRLGISPFELTYGRPIPITAPTFSSNAVVVIEDNVMKQYISGLWAASSSLCRYVQQHLPKSLDGPVHPFNPGDLVLIRTWKEESLKPRWQDPYQVLLTTHNCLKVEGVKPWIHHTWVRYPAKNTTSKNTTSHCQGRSSQDSPMQEQGLPTDNHQDSQGPASRENNNSKTEDCQDSQSPAPQEKQRKGAKQNYETA